MRKMLISCVVAMLFPVLIHAYQSPTRTDLALHNEFSNITCLTVEFDYIYQNN